MMHLLFRLSVRIVEDILLGRGIDISHKTVRSGWSWHRLVFAADIEPQRRYRMRGLRQRRRYLVEINGQAHHLCRWIDQQAESRNVQIRKNRIGTWARRSTPVRGVDKAQSIRAFAIQES